MQDEDRFKLWYVAGSSWMEIDGKMMPVYTINYLESPDGIRWGDEEELRFAFKKRVVTEAKASFSYLAIRKMGYSGREVGQFLNMRSYSAVRIPARFALNVMNCLK